jgi:hypothetical protein
LVLASAARAEPTDATAQFATGMRLMREGVLEHDPAKIAQACAALDESNRLEVKAGTLIQLADCRERNHQLASAWAVYRDALMRARDPRKRKLAADQVHALEPRLSTLTIAVDDASRLDGLSITLDGATVDPSAYNHPRPIDGGTHVIAGHAPGHVDWQTTAQIAIERDAGRVEVPALAPVEVAPVEVAPVVVAPVEVVRPIAPPPPSPPPASWLTRRREVALGLAGAGVASAVVGALVGASANTRKDDAVSLCPGSKPGVTTPCVQADHANALIHSAHDRALAANVLFGVAGASAVAAGLLWFTGAPPAESPRLSVAPSVAPTQAGLVVMGRF